MRGSSERGVDQFEFELEIDNNYRAGGWTWFEFDFGSYRAGGVDRFEFEFGSTEPGEFEFDFEFGSTTIYRAGGGPVRVRVRIDNN